MTGLDLMMHDRFLKIFSNCLGEKITIKLKDECSYQGLLFSFDPLNFDFLIINNPKVYDKNYKKYNYLYEANKKINSSDICCLNLNHKKLKKLSKGNFQTDVDISKKTSAKLANNKNSLVQFDVGNSEIYHGNLEESDLNWNQFELNKNKFNVETSYDEKHYTTELNHSKIPEKLKVKADKIIKDIIDNTKDNDILHLREERGLIGQTENDSENEEDKYSSVLRTANN